MAERMRQTSVRRAGPAAALAMTMALGLLPLPGPAYAAAVQEAATGGEVPGQDARESGAAAARAASPVDLVGRPVVSVRVETVGTGTMTEASDAVLLRRGDPYTLEAVQESLQNLYALGTVSTADVLASDGSAGIDVLFVVEPRLRLYDVEFEGDPPWSGRRLRRALSVRDGEGLEPEVVTRQARLLQQALADDGYLMADVSAAVRSRDRPTRGILSLHVDPGTRAHLAALTLEGDLGLTEPRVREILELVPREPFRPADLDEGLTRLGEALNEEHYFHHSVEVVEQSFDLQTGDVTLAIEVQAGPRVELVISGMEESEDELHDEMAIFEFGTADDWALKESRQQLVTYLQRRGYWRPLVAYTRTRDAEDRNVDVQFRVLRGNKESLKRIAFTGNDAVTDDTLRAVIRTDTGGFLRGGRFIAEWWEQDQEAVVTAYARRGYREARVIEAPVGLEQGDLVARMVIEEGVRTEVRALDLLVASEYPTPGIELDAWRGQLELRANGPFDSSAVRRDTDRLRGLLTNAGYPQAVITSDVRAAQDSDPDAPTVIATITIHPGERVRIDRVLVTGNESTHPDVIRRELGVIAGGPYSFADVLETQSRLYRTGLFDEVDVSAAVPDSLDSERSVVVRVHEAPPVVISYGGGFDTEEKLRGIFSIAHENLRGRNEEISFSARVSLREQRLRLLFQEPYLLGRRLETTASLFYSDEREPSFDVRRYGGSLNVLLRRRDGINVMGRYTFRDVQTSNLDLDPALIAREDRSTRVGALGGSVLYDTRPDPIDPRSGAYQTLDVDVAAEQLGGAQNFATLFARSFWYAGLSDTLTLATALRAGVQLPYAGTDTVPLPERFFSGGSTSLRGFALDRAGPVDSRGNPLGGEAVVVINLETRYDILGDLGVVGFFDWGNVFAKPADVRLTNFRETLGVGARYDTAVGPVRLDVAWLLDRRAEEDAMQIFLSVGHTF